MRRQWLKNPKLGIKVVHVDPYYNAIGAVPARQMVRAEADHLGRDGDGDRLRLDQGRPLRQGIRRRPTPSASTSGRPICSATRTALPKTPEWQEKETGVPAKDVRALAREWGKKRVYLAPGGWGNGHGGACRNQTGIQWARVMVCLIAMQGLGKPGINMGNLQWGTPDRLQFLFPRLCRRRHVGRSRKHLDAGRALSAHAAAADHEHARPAHPAHLRARGDHRRQGRGLSVGRQVDRAPVRASSPIRRPAMRRCTCSTNTAARSSRP